MRNYWTEELPIKRWADKKSAGSRIVTIQMVKFVLAQELKKSKSRYDGGENQSSKLLCGNWVSNDKIAKALNYVGDTIAAGVEEIFAKFPDAQAVGFSMDNFTHGSAELWMLYYMYGKTVITKPLLPEPDDRTFLSAIDWAFSVFIEALFFQDKSDSFGIGVLLNPRLGLPIEAGNTENESDSSDPEDLLDAGAGDLPEEPVLRESELITNSQVTKGIICTTSGSGGTAPICGGGGGAPESRMLYDKCRSTKIPRYLVRSLSAVLLVAKNLQPCDVAYSDDMSADYIRAVTMGIDKKGAFICRDGVVFQDKITSCFKFRNIVGLVLGDQDGKATSALQQLRALKILRTDRGPSMFVDWDLLADYYSTESRRFELVHKEVLRIWLEEVENDDDLSTVVKERIAEVSNKLVSLCEHGEEFNIVSCGTLHDLAGGSLSNKAEWKHLYNRLRCVLTTGKVIKNNFRGWAYYTLKLDI